MQRPKICLGLLVCAVLLAASNAVGIVEPLREARFFVNGEEVRRGTFGSPVFLDEVIFDEVSYSSQLGELREPSDLHVSFDPSGNGAFLPLILQRYATDYPLRFAFPHGNIEEDTRGAAPIGEGIDLSRIMLSTDGSADVRLDVFFSTPLIDNSPSRDDNVPEAIILGDFQLWHSVRIAAIVGHAQDQPVLAGTPVKVDPEHFVNGRTNIAFDPGDGGTPTPLTIIGLDLHGDLGVERGANVIGLRLEVSRGTGAIFTLLGAQQHPSGSGGSSLIDGPDEMLHDDSFEYAIAITSGSGSPFGRSGIRAAPRAGQTSFRSGGFSGGGGGRGGGFPFQSGSPQIDEEPGGQSPDPPPGPVIPAPATLPIVLMVLAVSGQRRRRRCEPASMQ